MKIEKIVGSRAWRFNQDAKARKYTAIGISIVGVFFTIMALVSMFFFVVADSGAKRARRIITIIAGSGSVYVLFRLSEQNSTPNYLNLFSILLYCYSIFIFCWAWRENKTRSFDFVGSNRMPKQIIQEGPYKFVRHPFYASYISAWIASYISTRDIIVLFISITLFIFYFHHSMREEKRFLDSHLSEQFRIYSSKSGMFIPRLSVLANFLRKCR